MESEIIKMVSTPGIWAVLSIVLIFYILKAQDNRDVKQDLRENNYQEIISKLTDKLNVIEDVKKDVDEIKSS